MRIALISTPFLAVPPRQYGGTELVVYELAEGLVRHGHDVTLFGTGDSHTSAQLRWLYTTALWPPDPLADLNHVAWAMQQIGRDGAFDLIHAHSAAALACGRFLRDVPLVYTLHHPRDEALSSYYRYYPDVQYIAISEDQLRREIPLPHLTLIHHGLDPQTYHVAPNGPDRYLCFVGRYSRVKGPHTAIDVARAAGLPIRLAGEVHSPDERWAATELTPRLAHLHVSELGPIDITEKAALLARARALLAPIEWHEPFGLILIEAMLSGCPVVTFGLGSARELVDEGVTGFIAESREDMIELVRPGGAIEGIDREACRQRAIERFSAERMVIDHITLYEDVRAASERAPRDDGPDSRLVA